VVRNTRSVGSSNGSISYHPCDDDTCSICAPDNPEEYPRIKANKKDKKGQTKNE